MFKLKLISFLIFTEIIIVINLINGVNSCRFRDSYRFSGTDLILRLDKNSGGRRYSIVRNGKVVQSFTIDVDFSDSVIKYTPKMLTIYGKNQTTQFEIVNYHPENTINNNLNGDNQITIINVKRNLTRNQTSQDCFDLNIGQMNWYGGPEIQYQYWPIEKSTFENFSYVTKHEMNCAIAERYWLNSNGIFIYIENEVPLFLNQNTNEFKNQICFNATKILPYNIDDDDGFILNYRIGIASNPRLAHLYVTNHIFKKPTQIPDERMIRYPIWSTWALYKSEINEEIVRDFANNITFYNFNNSQLEIDDNWETCYGSLTFDEEKFPNIKNLTDDLKEQGFRITLWIHPFINKNCTEWYNEAKESGYLVEDHNGNTDIQWWNSLENDAALIDFTNYEAANWFKNRLLQLKEDTGIDSFKFDAGESSWSPLNAKQNGSKNLQPNLITQAYVRTVAELGSFIEIRTGQSTQDLGVFVRMIDKDSEWNWNNGLITLLTTLFQMNFAGYNFVLPDMIGGNGYNDRSPNKEMFIRWLQANALMPSLQFSYVPWMFDINDETYDYENSNETVEISHKFTKLHDEISDYIIERFNLVVQSGEPVNPPIWWIDPSDVVARQIYDEFLLGDKYLSAPVLNPNCNERDIYLPKGRWIDGNTDEIHIGPKWLMRYPAPLDTLPYFIREDEQVEE